MTIKLCLIIMAYYFFSFRLFLTSHQVSNCPRYRFSPSAFRKQLTGHSGQTGRDFVFIFSLGHLLMTPTKMGKTNINLTSVTFHLYLAPQMLPSFSRRHIHQSMLNTWPQSVRKCFWDEMNFQLTWRI